MNYKIIHENILKEKFELFLHEVFIFGFELYPFISVFWYKKLFFLSILSRIVFFVGFMLRLWAKGELSRLKKELKELRKNAPGNIVFLSYSSPYRTHSDRLKQFIESKGFKVLRWDSEKPFEKAITWNIIHNIIQASIYIRFEEDNTKWVTAEQAASFDLRKAIIEIPLNYDEDILTKTLIKAGKIGKPYNYHPYFLKGIIEELIGNGDWKPILPGGDNSFDVSDLKEIGTFSSLGCNFYFISGLIAIIHLLLTLFSGY